MMRIIYMALFLWMMICSAFAKQYVKPPEYTLDPMYLPGNGAIATWTSGNKIDPYFPTKALLMADDKGMDIHTIGRAWVEWLMARQDANGLFNRYCLDADKHDKPCEDADADDAMLAMWVELLYRLSPRGGLPEAWKESAAKAIYQLDLLYDTKLTVFMVSKNIQAGLLIDNIEIYSAFEHIAVDALRIGDGRTYNEFHKRAEFVKTGIAGAFWDAKQHRFKASTQPRTQDEFYPDAVAQVFPLLYGFKSHYVKQPGNLYGTWMKKHRDEWLGIIGHEYPWGILAVLALQENDPATAACWMQRVTPYRNTQLWNVLDETAYQIVAAQVKTKDLKAAQSCAVKGAS